MDDEQGIRELLSDFLADLGFEVIEAGDGQVALETARQERPDLIILDDIKPIMSGREVSAGLRREPRYRRGSHHSADGG